MPLDNDTVTIIIPNHNRALLLKETLDSITDQSYLNWEAIIVDDGSTDNSLEVIKAYATKDPRITYRIRERLPKGAPTCRNIGVENAKGNYLIFLDSDDLLASTCLEKRIKFMAKKPDLNFAVFPTQFFKNTPGDTDEMWLYKNFENYLDGFLYRAQWQTTSPIWRKESIVRLGGFKEGLRSWQDWDLHVRALAEDFKFEVSYGPPDNFCRRAGQKSISQTDKELEAKHALSNLFDELSIHLEQKGKLTELRKKLLAGKYFVCSARINSLKIAEDGKYIWQKALANCLISKSEFERGWGYIKIANTPLLKQNQILKRLFSKLSHLWLSKYITWNY